MQTKLKVSYKHDSDLDTVLKILKPIMISSKISKAQQGEYKRAYITVEPDKVTIHGTGMKLSPLLDDLNVIY